MKNTASLSAKLIRIGAALLQDSDRAANDLIKADNPEMTDDQIAYGIEKMKEYGIAVSGDADATPGPDGKPGFNRFEVYGRMAAELLSELQASARHQSRDLLDVARQTIISADDEHT